VITTVLLALGSSLSYGVSDFLGAVGTRKLRVLPGTTIIYLFALATLLVALPIAGGAWSIDTIVWGTVAGVAAIGGFLTFYAALAAGPINLAAPLIAVLSSLVPVVAAIALGEQLEMLAWVAIVLALAGAGLISVTRRGAAASIPRKTLVLAVIAGILLGLSIIALDRAPQTSGVTSAVIEILVGVIVLGVLVALVRLSPRTRRALSILDENQDDAALPSPWRARIACAVGGILLGVGNALLLLALQSGSLAVVSVLIGLYPVATMVLARIVHGERLTRVQLGGVVLAIAATVLLALA
jgi:drug/metabolite transporter (DMT)-like permease